MNNKWAIPTVYKSIRMKSRLHADVAFLLDRLGWKWDYQPQGFLLEDGHQYLPDFHVPHLGLWVAVLEHEPDIDEEAELEGFAQHLSELENEASFPTYWVIKHTGGTLQCYDDLRPDTVPELARGGFFGYCFHCQEWVYVEQPIEEELTCPGCVPNPGQVARWFWLEGRDGALSICSDGASWVLREWITGYKEQDHPWKATHRTIACAYCHTMFNIKNLGVNVIQLGPGETLPPSWIIMSHQGITDYYCSQSCAASDLLTTIVEGQLREDGESPVGQHLDAIHEVENMLYDFIPGATRAPASEEGC